MQWRGTACIAGRLSCGFCLRLCGGGARRRFQHGSLSSPSCSFSSPFSSSSSTSCGISRSRRSSIYTWAGRGGSQCNAPRRPLNGEIRQAAKLQGILANAAAEPVESRGFRKLAEIFRSALYGPEQLAGATRPPEPVDSAQQLVMESKETVAASQPQPLAGTIEEAEEDDMRHAEEVISAIDADHKLIELAPEPSSAELRLTKEKLAYISQLKVPGFNTDANSNMPARKRRKKGIAGNKGTTICQHSVSKAMNFKDHWDARMLGKGMRANHLKLCYLNVAVPGGLGLCKWQDKTIAVRSAQSMNRAVDRDQVAIHLLPIGKWTLGLTGPTVESQLKVEPNLLTNLVDGQIDIESPFFNQEYIDKLCQGGLVMAGEVVRVVSSFNSKCFVGSLTLSRAIGRNVALFTPRDRKAQKMLLPIHPLFMGLEVKRKLQEGLANNLSETYTVAVKMVDWPSHLSLPVGEVLPLDTDLATIEGATRAVLVEAGIEERPFSPAVLDDVPKTFYISRSDREGREDFTDRCVISIDPATARDLDDALHVRVLSNGSFEVGVHIADVSHFVPPESALDREARRRSTSVYLVQRVIPMLPEALSNGYCSLHPGEEKLAFSVIFSIDFKLNIQSYRFTKSIIKSCCRLSYEEAQRLLVSDDYAPVVAEPFSRQNVRTVVRQLYSMSQKFRRQRLRSGALGFSVAKKLQFTCPTISATEDSAEGVPQLMKEEEAELSHQLVEEWMLKANVAAAETLVAGAPNVALLRRHQPPKSPKALADTLASLAKASSDGDGGGEKGKKISIDPAAIKEKLRLSSSANGSPVDTMRTLNEFLESLSNVEFRNFSATLSIMQMSLAEYICTGFHSDPEAWRHFALQFPVYTHFTSPIRRYADLLVHRQLARVLLGSQQSAEELPPPQQPAEQVEAQAMWCNRWRISAKRASERSAQLFLAAFLRSAGPAPEVAFVRDVGRQVIELMCPQLVFTTRLDLNRAMHQMPGLKVNIKASECRLTFPPTETCEHEVTLKLQFGSPVPVFLEALPDNLLTVGVRLRRPDCPKCSAEATSGIAAQAVDVAKTDPLSPATTPSSDQELLAANSSNAMNAAAAAAEAASAAAAAATTASQAAVNAAEAAIAAAAEAASDSASSSSSSPFSLSPSAAAAAAAEAAATAAAAAAAAATAAAAAAEAAGRNAKSS